MTRTLALIHTSMVFLTVETTMVSAAARELVDKADVLVLAQASMTRLAPRLQGETGLPVLTSPRLGIEHARHVLDELG